MFHLVDNSFIEHRQNTNVWDEAILFLDNYGNTINMQV